MRVSTRVTLVMADLGNYNFITPHPLAVRGIVTGMTDKRADVPALSTPLMLSVSPFWKDGIPSRYLVTDTAPMTKKNEGVHSSHGRAWKQQILLPLTRWQ